MWCISKAQNGIENEEFTISLKITDIKVDLGPERTAKKNIYVRVSHRDNDKAKLWKSKAIKPKEVLEWTKQVNIHVPVRDNLVFTVKEKHPVYKPWAHNRVWKKGELAIEDVLHKFVSFEGVTQDIEIAGGTIHINTLKESLPEALKSFEPTNVVLEKWPVYSETVNAFLHATKDVAGMTDTAQGIIQDLDKLHRNLQDQASCNKQIPQLLDAMSLTASEGDRAYQVSLPSASLETIIKDLAGWMSGSLKLVLKRSEVNMVDQIFFYNHTGEAEDFSKQFQAFMVQYQDILMFLGEFSTITMDEKDHLKNILTPLDSHLSSQCLSGTREDILTDIRGHILEKDIQAIWIEGIAGAGKSCIAGTLQHSISTLSNIILGGTFQCLKGSRSEDCSRLLPSLSFQLACAVPAYGKRLLKVLKNTLPGDLPRSLKMQYELLFHKPLQEFPRVVEHSAGYKVILIIDGLDEWGSVQDRRELLSFMKYFTSQTDWICLVITSRPDWNLIPLIRDWSCAKVVDLTSARGVKDDLVKYLVYGFTNLSLTLPQDQISHLADLADGSFIWARTALKFVEQGDGSQQRVGSLLRLQSESARLGGQYGALYALYDMILKEMIPDDSESLAQFQKVAGTILVLSDGLSKDTLCKLLETNLSAEIILYILTQLQAIFYPAEDGIITFHQSFAEYMFGKKARSVYALDLADCHFQLAELCLDIMGRHLSFNMAGIKSSYFSNADAVSEEQLSEVLPPHVQYACCYWATHSSQCAGSWGLPSLEDKILGFLENEKMVYWIEAVSLMGNVYVVRESIIRLKSCLKNESGHLFEHLEEIHQFIDAFSGPITESAAHLYISALPMTPTDTWLRQTFQKHMGQIIQIAEIPRKWPVVIQQMSEEAAIECVAYSLDGRYIVVGLITGLIRQWSVETGEAIGEGMEGHTGQVNALIYSPDGRHIASGSNDKTLCIWNTESGERELVISGHDGGVLCIAYSPDGQHIVSGSNDWTIRVWDSTTGEQQMRVSHGDHMAYSVAYSPDGKHIVFGSTDHTVRIWDVGTREEVQLIGHTFLVISVVYSPDGKLIASGSADDTIRIWNAETGREEKVLLGHGDWVNAVAFSPDGKHIVSGSEDRTTRTWNVDSGEEERKFTGARFRVTGVAYSRDGCRIASVSNDRIVRIWSTLSGPQEPQITDWVNSVAYSPDGKYIVVGSSDCTVKILNAETGKQELQFEGHSFWVNAVAFAPDKRFVVSGSGAPDTSIRIWNMQSGREILLLKGHSNSISSVAFSPNGQYVASGSYDRTLIIWNVKSGRQEMQLKGHKDLVSSIAYSPDGEYIASGSHDGVVMIWSSEYGHQVVQLQLTGYAGVRVTSVAYAPDGKYVVSGSGNGIVRVWSVETRKEVMRFEGGHLEEVTSVAYSPDGSRIVSGSDDGSVRVWSVESGREVMKFLGHSGGVKCVGYLKDGKSIVSGSYDGSVRIWAAEQGLELTSPHTNPGSSSSFTTAYQTSLINQWRMSSPETKTKTKETEHTSPPPRTVTHGHSGNSTHWLVSVKDDEQNHKLLWVPGHLHAGFKSPQVLTIPPYIANHAVHIDSSSFKYGEEWTEAWIPGPQGSRVEF